MDLGKHKRPFERIICDVSNEALSELHAAAIKVPSSERHSDDWHATVGALEAELRKRLLPFVPVT